MFMIMVSLGLRVGLKLVFELVLGLLRLSFGFILELALGVSLGFRLGLN